VGLTESHVNLGVTLSNFLGQMVVEKFGHLESLMGSLILSLVPIFLICFLPETLGLRTQHHPTMPLTEL
jgi:predicted MFS family arabinose efflux permease